MANQESRPFYDEEAQRKQQLSELENAILGKMNKEIGKMMEHKQGSN